MKKFVCKTTCFFGNRLWLPGETLEAEVANKHFVLDADYEPKQEADESGDPRTMSELIRQGAVPSDDFLN